MLKEIYKIEQLDDGTYLIDSLKGQFKKSLTELSIEELRKTIGQLGSTANKRISRIQSTGVYSPAVPPGNGIRAVPPPRSVQTPQAAACTVCGLRFVRICSADSRPSGRKRRMSVFSKPVQGSVRCRRKTPSASSSQATGALSG